MASEASRRCCMDISNKIGGQTDHPHLFARLETQVTERIRTYAPGRGRGRGMGPPGAPFRAGALPGRGVPGREPYPGQPEFEGAHPRSYLPGPPSASRASDWPPRNNGYPVRSLRDVPQSSVMKRLGPRVSQDRQKPAMEPEFAPAEAPVSSEVVINPAALTLLSYLLLILLHLN